MTQWTESRAICYAIEQATKKGMYRTPERPKLGPIIFQCLACAFILGVIVLGFYLLTGD